MHPSTALMTRASHYMHTTSHQTFRHTSSSAPTDACHAVCLVMSTHQHLLLYLIQGFLRRPTGTGCHRTCSCFFSRFFGHSLGHGLGRLFGNFFTKESYQGSCNETEQTRATLLWKDPETSRIRCPHQCLHLSRR